MEVFVFYSSVRERWILRLVSDIGLRYGDDEIKDEPSDELLLELYGDVKITREYGITSTAMMNGLRAALKASNRV